MLKFIVQLILVMQLNKKKVRVIRLFFIVCFFFFEKDVVYCKGGYYVV